IELTDLPSIAAKKGKKMDSVSGTSAVNQSESGVSEPMLPAETRPIAISINGLTQKYGPMTAVNNLSLSVQTGRLFGFLGPNGAGKSTTIGCLTGLIDPTAGRIEILGQ